jgi:hypothetical protein
MLPKHIVYAAHFMRVSTSDIRPLSDRRLHILGRGCRRLLRRGSEVHLVADAGVFVLLY